jgi:RNA polymerase sigma-70 factor (ECF subfamily)
MFKSFESYDSTRPFSPWASRITYNVCLRRLEGKSAAILREAVERDLCTIGDEGGKSPEGRTQHAQAGEALERAMGYLSAQDRALLTMRYRQGLSIAEVAEAVSMPVNTVKTRLFKARKTLRKHLSPAFADASF